ncbi:MAG: pilus assembly protein PilM [Phycisphaerae bacterium]
MLLSLLRKRPWPIALEVGSDSIKMLQFQRVGGQLHVAASARWKFPGSIPLEDRDHRRELAPEAIREMLKNNNFRGKRVVSCLSSLDLQIKNVRLPQMPEEELIKSIAWEAGERFNQEVTSDTLGWLHAGQIRQGGEKKNEIILLAADQNALDGHLKMIDQAGLVPTAIDAEPIAVFRSFERFLRRTADEEVVTVVLDMGLAATRVIVGKGRSIIFMKSIPIGGKKLNEAVADQLNLGYQEAVELRERIMRSNECGETNSVENPNSVNWTVHDAVRGAVDELAREVALCLRYCSVTFRGLRPRKVFLTGGEAYDPAVMQLLSEQLNIDVKVAQPLQGMDVSAADLGSDRRGVMPEWATCAGLALRPMMEGKAALEAIDHEQSRLSA